MPRPDQSVARSALWNHLGKVVEYSLMYLASVLIARGLGIQLYGHFAALLSGLHILLVLSSFGLEVALTRYVASLDGPDIQPRLRFLFRRGIAVRLALFGGAAGLGLWAVFVLGWIGIQEDHVVILLLLGYGLTRNLIPLSVAVLTARFRTRRVAVFSVAGRTLEITGLLLLGPDGMTLANVSGILLVSGVLQVFLHLVWSAENWLGEEEALPLRPVMLFGGVFWLNTFVDYFLGRQGDVALLALLGGNPVATSYYDVSYTLLQAGAMVATVGLGGVSLAALSRIPKVEMPGKTSLYETLVRITSLLTIPVLGFLFVGARDILALVYAGPYVGAAHVLQLLVGFRIFSRLFAGGENADFLLSLDLVWPLVRIGMIAAGVTIILHAFLIPLYAAAGAAMASGLGTLVANGLGLRRVRAAAPVRIQWRSWLSLTMVTVGAGVIAALVIPEAPTMTLLLGKITVFGGSWYALGMLFRPLEQRDSAVLGRSLSFLTGPMLLLTREGGKV